MRFRFSTLSLSSWALDLGFAFGLLRLLCWALAAKFKTMSKKKNIYLKNLCINLLVTTLDLQRL
jgi:hypothetical protein